MTVDLDGTLVKDTVFETVSRTAGFHEAVLKHDADFFAGKITLEACFHLEYRFLVGLKMEQIEAALEKGHWVTGIKEAVTELKAAGLKPVLLTDQPRFLAEWPLRFGFEDAVCSEAVVKDGVVTKDVTPRFDKLSNLTQWCRENDVRLHEVAHVGNGENDIPVFGAVGFSVAVNPAKASVSQAAKEVFTKMTDLRQVSRLIVDHKSRTRTG